MGLVIRLPNPSRRKRPSGKHSFQDGTDGGCLVSVPPPTQQCQNAKTAEQRSGGLGDDGHTDV